MQIVRTRKEMQQLASTLCGEGKSIGFVPTMGFLHEGHLSLVRRARAENQVVVVSIFVNPTQFGPNEDFEKYPRDFESDRKLVESLVDYLFYPPVDEIYNKNEKVTFALKDITNCLCGISRPTHFQGVALVVAKLFNIVRPDRVYFGQKDYQQTVVIRSLIQELFFKIELLVCPTIRASDGLALSSRNVYLNAQQRARATILYQALQFGVGLFETGEKKIAVVIQKMRVFLEDHGITDIDYVDIRDAQSLVSIEQFNGRAVVLALAGFFGKTRLIDNIIYPCDEIKK